MKIVSSTCIFGTLVPVTSAVTYKKPPFPAIVGLCQARLVWGNIKVRRFSFPLVISCAFAFVTMASGEVLRSHSKHEAADQEVVAVVVTPVSTTTPKLTGREKRAEAAAAAAALVEPAPAVVDAAAVVADVTAPRLTGREIRAEAAAAASALADVPPVFLPVTTAPAVSTLNASGERTSRRFQKTETVVSTPEINLNPAPFAVVPEPPSTSLLLVGLFGTGMFFVRRYRVRQA